MVRFFTESGSLYEVDWERSEIRRLSGTCPPTSRQGPDGTFKKFVQLMPDPIVVGSRVLIIWEWQECVARATSTSEVTEIQSV